ncbi:MAG: hypothetical protein LRS49_02625 [Desulfurococcales archaeon]|nr:hypothetical protein [Desulfurococcales archaeon]
MPKYVACSDRKAPWALGAAGRMCRILDAYSASSLRVAARRGGVEAINDPLYGAPQPLLRFDSILCIAEPRRALERAVAQAGDALEYALAEVVGMLGPRVRPHLGLTGTLALGMHRAGVSDVDLVVYGDRASERMLEEFSSLRGEPPGPPRRVVGGVRIAPPTDLSWRRAGVGGISVSWIGAPSRPASHCPPLREWRHLRPPRGRAHIETSVEPGQPGALLYPPCVRTVEGLFIVSYEYNLALHMYVGGRMRVEGLRAGEAVILGSAEHPGSLVLLGRGENIGSLR